MAKTHILFDPKKSYRKVVSLRRACRTTNTVECSIPHQVLLKEATARGITIEEFTKKFSVEHIFGDFEGGYYLYHFVKREIKDV